MRLSGSREPPQIADEGFKEAERLIRGARKGLTELDVSAAIERVLKKKGAIGPSFDIIVASGARSALPHGIASDKLIKKGEFVIVDMGALYRVIIPTRPGHLLPVGRRRSNWRSMIASVRRMIWL